MKRIIALLTLFFGSFLFSQTHNFRFASLSASEIESIQQRPGFDFTSDELKNLPLSDLLNIYVEEFIEVADVQGHGKMATLLALDIDENGVLQKVSASGANESFNLAATDVFKKFEGKKMDIYQLRNVNLELLIPISIEL